MRGRNLLWVAALVVGAGLLVFWLVTIIGERRAAGAYGQELTSLCVGYEPASELGGMEPGGKLVVLRGNGQRIHRFHSDLPDAQRADTAGEVDYVICMRDYSSTVQECTYTRGGRVKRIRRGYEVLAIDPVLGTPVAFDRVLGPNPGRCPDSKSPGLFGEKIKGDYPRFTYAEFSSLLVTFYTSD